jgi:uncharacterized membrane protein YgdD (TMEM256/DUF423 family)
MEEQRMLDEMERNLAAEDPRLAARLGAFGQQRLRSPLRSQQARTISGVLALALIAAVTIMVFVISPFAHHAQNDPKTTVHPPPAAGSTTQASGKN